MAWATNTRIAFGVTAPTPPAGSVVISQSALLARLNGCEVKMMFFVLQTLYVLEFLLRHLKDLY